MNNSISGKTENLRNRINAWLVNNAKACTKYTSKPHFPLQKIFNKDFVAINEIKPDLTLDRV